MTGRVSNIPLPSFMRSPLYRAFGKAYGVNFDEIKEGNLANFRCFNEFFTRELKEEARPIENEYSKTSLASPVDARVLTIGEVDTVGSRIDCIKGHSYPLDEFLFGLS